MATQNNSGQMLTHRKRGPIEIFTQTVKETYLATLSKTGTVAESCRAAQITRETVREHREKYPDFAIAEARAMDDYRDLMIEAEIRRRGIEGIEEPVFDKEGNQSGTRTKYSDTLLIFHAKRHIPEYRDAPAQITQVTFLQIPERLSKHLEARRAMLQEVAVQGGKGNGNGHT